MRSGLFWKLFLLQVAAAAAVIAGALAVTRVYSMRGFAEFLELRQRAHVEQLAAEVAEQYGRTGDLAAAADQVPSLRPRRHIRRQRDAAPVEPFSPAEADAGPPHGDAPQRDDPRRPAIVIRRVEGLPPLQVQDAEGRHVRGVRRLHPDDQLREPITVDGTVVGYLAWPRWRREHHPEHDEFARKQARHFAVIAPIALAVAAAFAMLITALIVRPIRRLSEGATALAARRFDLRLPADRRDELGQLARDFNRLAEALQGYDARQRQWLADVAHELRTPVAVLRGELEAALDGVRPAGAGMVASLRQEVSRIESLIEDLRLVALAESGGLALHRERADVGRLVAQAVARFRQRLAARGFEVREAIDPGLVAEVDPPRLEQVLANLLENAIRHAAPPGPVTVAARESRDAARGSTREIEITVADAGPGVPADALPRLFDRLYRVDAARARASGGGGLGLAICKSIVEAHGGAIAARASAAGGLEIAVRLPA